MKALFPCWLALLGVACLPPNASAFKVRFSSWSRDVEAERGEMVVLPCSYDIVQHAKQPPKLMWFHGDRVLFANGTAMFPMRLFRLAGNSLQVTVNGRDQAGEYTCRLGPTDDLWLYHTIRLPGPPIIRASATELEVKEGGTINIQCKTFSVPEPEVSFTMEGSPFSLAQFTREDMLRIDDVRRKDAGTYVCSATNGLFPDARARILVRYVGRPDIHLDVLWTNLGEMRGTGVEITCRTPSESPVTVAWLMGPGREPVNGPNFEITRRPSYSVLRIRNASPAYYSNYTCIAGNDHGIAQESVEISTVPTKPSVTRLSRGDAPTFAIVSACPVWISSFRIGYREAYTRDDHTVVDLAVPRNPHLGSNGRFTIMETINYLKPGTHYEAYAQATSVRGETSAKRYFMFWTNVHMKTELKQPKSAVSSERASVWLIALVLVAAVFR